MVITVRLNVASLQDDGKKGRHERVREKRAEVEEDNVKNGRMRRWLEERVEEGPWSWVSVRGGSGL
jgi:hypothetical protein